MDAENYTDACPKLAESARRDPNAGGTLLLLALCYEKSGRLASAWAEYEAARAVARRDGRADREQFARGHGAALAPRLVYLTVRVENKTAALPGLEIKVDGQTLGRGGWGTRLPTDAGSHDVSAVAPGYKVWAQTIAVGGLDGKERELLVPPLERDEAPWPAAASASSSLFLTPAALEPDPRGRRTAAYLFGAAGLVAVGVGTYFGLHAAQKQSEVKSECPSGRCQTNDGEALNDSAHSAARGADVAFAIGLVGLGVGTYLFLTSRPPDRTSTGLRVTPLVGPRGAGLGGGGVF